MMNILCGLLLLRSVVNYHLRHYFYNSFWKQIFNVKCFLYLHIILQNSVKGIDIRNSPESHTILEGETFQLDCTVRHHVKVPISWYRNEQKIATYDPKSAIKNFRKDRYNAYYHLGNQQNNIYVMLFVLSIKSVEVIDESYEYKCAANSSGQITWSGVSNIEVMQIPDSKYPLCQPQRQSFNENENKQLICRSEDIIPAITLQWYKNGKELNSLTQYNDDDKEIEELYDFHVKYEDASAEFLCVQSSKSIPKLNRNCSIGPIFVNFIPRVSIEYRGHNNRSVNVRFNEVNVLICHAKTAHANPKFKWKFSKHLEDGDYSLSPDNHFVTFAAKSVHNNLIATCTVMNNLGSGSANITIHVINIKEPTKQPMVITFPSRPKLSPVPPSLVVAIIGICTLFIVIVMSSVLCCLKFYTHRQFINAHMRRQEIYQRHEPPIGCTIAQPEIYFEPKDSISQSTNTSDGTSSTKRSIGIQVLPQVNLELQDIHQQQTLPARYRGRPLPQPGRSTSPMIDCGCSFV